MWAQQAKMYEIYACNIEHMYEVNMETEQEKKTVWIPYGQTPQ